MKATILLCIVVLLAGVMLTPTEATASDDGPVITRAIITATHSSFELDDGSQVTLDRRVMINGSGFYGTARGPFVRFLDEQGGSVDAVVVTLLSDNRIEAWPPPGTQGRMTLVVENPDRRKASATIEL